MSPRIRTLKPECWQDETLGTVSRDARLLFIGLITQADDDGLLRGASPLVKAQVFPYDAITHEDVETWLEELAGCGLILRYEAKGERFVALVGWKQNQRISHATKSLFPRPPEDSGGLSTDSGGPVSGKEGIGRDKERGSNEPLLSGNGFKPEVYRLCLLLAESVSANGSKRPDPEQREWLIACRLMLDTDKRPVVEAERLIRWCQSDEFWRANILSMPKFRKQYDQLRLKAPKVSRHLAESRSNPAAYVQRKKDEHEQWMQSKGRV